jgi:cell division septation protein DedD
MGKLGRRYTHVPLGLVSMLLVVMLIAWLLERRVDGVWDPAFRIAAPVPVAVSLAAVPASAAAPAAPVAVEPEPVTDRAPVAEPPVPVPAPAPAAPPPAAAPVPVERYVLESGPFLAADGADRIEDQLNHLGYATIRFRKQEVRRLFVVTATGFASVRDAQRAAADLGRGSVLEGEQGLDLAVDRLPSLGEAIAAARPLRARGFEVRVNQEVSPAVIYHVRYGQFAHRAAAEARAEELALFGLVGRVVKVP